MTHDPTGTELNQLTFYGKKIEKTGITKIDFNENQLSEEEKKDIHVGFFIVPTRPDPNNAKSTCF